MRNDELVGKCCALFRAAYVLDCLFDVRRFQVRVAVQDFVDAGAMGDLTYDDRNGDAHTADAGSAPHNQWIEGDPVELWHEVRLSLLR